MMDATSPLAPQASLGEEAVKGRRKVRLFAQDSSSSDEGAVIDAQPKINEECTSKGRPSCVARRRKHGSAVADQYQLLQVAIFGPRHSQALPLHNLLALYQPSQS